MMRSRDDELLAEILSMATPLAAPQTSTRCFGVVYRPSSDRWDNWVPTTMRSRYDAFLSVDHTEALRPLGPPTVALDGERATEPWAS
jgi:hypothetical protein